MRRTCARRSIIEGTYHEYSALHSEYSWKIEPPFASPSRCGRRRRGARRLGRRALVELLREGVRPGREPAHHLPASPHEALERLAARPGEAVAPLDPGALLDPRDRERLARRTVLLAQEGVGEPAAQHREHDQHQQVDEPAVVPEEDPPAGAATGP